MRTRRGYTVIEVMMALAVLIVGATGVIALQKVTVNGESHARRVAVANMIAQTWVERLRADALRWNNPSSGTDITDTLWLERVTDNEGQWIVPASTPPWGSAWADVNGDDIYPSGGGTEGAFCTHVRFTQLQPTLIRAEVRVFWARNGTTYVCNTDPTTVTPLYDELAFVHVVSGVFNNTYSE